VARGRETAYEGGMSESLLGLVSGLPYLVIDVVALALAVSRWNKHPTVSMFVAVGVAIQLFVRGLYLVGPSLMRSFGGVENMRLFFALGSVIGSVGSALIIAAVFAERRDAAGPPQQRW